tara:strand:- start:585 stop:848 length:264 start_codon:yes stop_codon:yes gene_type:complete
LIKAMLIVASLGINTEMPDMDSCLKARAAISAQDSSIKSLCIPKADETSKMKEMFSIFLNMIDQIKEYEEIDRLNDAENRFCEDCSG